MLPTKGWQRLPSLESYKASSAQVGLSSWVSIPRSSHFSRSPQSGQVSDSPAAVPQAGQASSAALPSEMPGGGCHSCCAFCCKAATASGASCFATASTSFVPQPPGTGVMRGVIPADSSNWAVLRIVSVPPWTRSTHSWSCSSGLICAAPCCLRAASAAPGSYDPYHSPSGFRASSGCRRNASH